MAINFFNSLAVGTNVLYVDTLNDRVGIGTSIPDTGTNLHVLTGTGSGQIKLQSQANTQFQFHGNGNQDINYGRPANFPSPPGDTYGQIRYSHSSDYMAFKVNNSERMRIDSSGRVGIGTSSPDHKLHLEESDTTSVFLKTENTAGSLLVGNNSSGNSFVSSQTSGKDLLFETANSERMRITSSGNVGIGTDSPDAKLEVNDSANDLQMRVGSLTAGISPYIRLQGKNTANTTNYYTDIELDAENGKLIFNDPGTSGGSIGTNPMVIDSSGNVGIGENDPDRQLHLKSSLPAIRLEDSDISGLYHEFFASTSGLFQFKADGGNVQANSGFLFQVDNSERMRIDSSGNVGIGTTNPGAKLDVYGTIRTFNSNGHILNGATNVVRTCTHPPENIFMSGKNNSVGGQNNAVIGSNNQIECSAEPWLQLGGNFIAGMNNIINTGYSHANAVFGQNNTLANSATLQAEAGSLMSGDGNILFGTNSFSWGYQTFSQADDSLTGGKQSVSFGNSGSMSVGLGCTASTGATQYAFGTGVTTPTTATAAEISDQFAIGKFNVYSTSIGHLFAIGNGTSDGARNTALAVIGEGTYTNGQLSLNDFNGYSSSTYNSRLHVSGNATKTTGSSWISVSDERLKSNIQVYEKGLSEILQITPKTFEFNGKAGTQAGQSQVGIIAQEIKDILPESINTFNKKLEETDETETELYDFNQDPLVYTLLNAVKELSAKIDTLENKIQTLEAN